MWIEVFYFGRLREISGQRKEKLNMPDGDHLSDVIRVLTEKYGNEFKVRITSRDNCSVLINGRHDGTIDGGRSGLNDGDQVVFLPVNMGG
jgi:MoaD family protein